MNQTQPILSLSDVYKTNVASGNITFDAEQAVVIAELQKLLDILSQKESPSFFQHIRQLLPWQSKKNISGIYLWGTVGAGKTYLMDLFYQHLPIKRKLRIHFHHFMKEVNDNLTLLQGQPDPLRIVARRFSMRARVICFDEFIVNHIADAMLLGRLLTFLFERNVTLVATSNRKPDDLYWEGLQRERFLPAIELLKIHCEVIQLSSQQDYRWRSLQQAGVYFTPLNEQAEQNMQQYFDRYAHGSGKAGVPLIIEKRPIATINQGKSVVWFDFKALCSSPRSQIDYLAIAKQFSVVLISHIPVIAPDDEATACYWIELIDIFYDNQITLILSAEAPLKSLYPTGKKQFEFERTLSRLIEMQSTQYLQKNHEKFTSM